MLSSHNGHASDHYMGRTYTDAVKLQLHVNDDTTTPCPNKKGTSGSPSNFGNSKDILTIFGTNITKITLNLFLNHQSRLIF